MIDVESLRLRWTYGDRYDACSADDPCGQLAPASLDERGAALLHVPQTTYRGFVTDLQCDLARFGLEPGPISGFFGPHTESAVRAFQEAASTCPHRPGGRTYFGGITGVVDDATRGEITIWRQKAYRRHEAMLDGGRQERLLCEVAHVLWGPKAFSRISHDPAGGLRFGLLGFSQRTGTLGELIWRMWSTSPRSFRHVFGADGESSLVPALTSQDPAERMAPDLAAENWTRRFATAGDVDFWQREQITLARERALRPVARLAELTGLMWERSVAVLLLVFIEAGGDAAVRLAHALGPRRPGTPIARHVAPAPEMLLALGQRLQSPSRHVASLLAEASFDDCAWLLT